VRSTTGRGSTGDSRIDRQEQTESRRRSDTINDAAADLTLRCTYAQRQIAVRASASRKKKVLLLMLPAEEVVGGRGEGGGSPAGNGVSG